MLRRRPDEPGEAVDGSCPGEESVDLLPWQLPRRDRYEVDRLRAAVCEANPLVASIPEALAAEPFRDRRQVVVAHEQVEVASLAGQRTEHEHRPGRGGVDELRCADHAAFLARRAGASPWRSFAQRPASWAASTRMKSCASSESAGGRQSLQPPGR